MLKSNFIKRIYLLSFWGVSTLFAGSFIPQSVTDQTPTTPLSNPTPGSYKIRYVSGFGLDNSFTLFFEDRNFSSGDTHPIHFGSTTTGPTGLPASFNATDIWDTHFLIKDWPITIGETEYAYRAWGSIGNNENHNFYVTNDLSDWTPVSTFDIPNAASFTNAKGKIYYGFHDIKKINGKYYAFGESSNSETIIARSTNGDDIWEGITKIGGYSRKDGPLQVPAVRTNGWTSNGSIMDLGYNRGCGALFADPNKQHFYLAINTAAKASLSEADFEAAFIDSTKWNWNNGTTGPAANPILSYNASHTEITECWLLPQTDIDNDWTVMYAGKFGSYYSVGYFTLTPPIPTVQTKLKIFLQGPYQAGGSMKTDLYNAGYVPTVSPYTDARDAGSVPSGVVDWVYTQLRKTETGSAVAERSFFLKSDGTVTETDGSTTDLTLTGTGEGNYFIVVKQRNHLSIMSKTEQTLGTASPALYDFTTDSTQCYGIGGVKMLETGVWGLIAGNANNANTGINVLDLSAVKSKFSQTGYLNADVNMSGGVNVLDFSKTKVNLAKASKVP